MRGLEIPAHLMRIVHPIKDIITVAVTMFVMIVTMGFVIMDGSVNRAYVIIPLVLNYPM